MPSGATRKIPNPIQAFLEDVAAASETAPGWLGVLLAGPGQGKTFTSEYLVSKMAQSKKLFPIYINSDQWRTIAPDDFGNLQKTIIHSFRHFETPIGWLEGCEEEFLMVTLKARLFRIVFDGFDEYVLRNQGRVSAPETLRALAKFVEVTGTRIAVTSRTSFWNSEIENVEEYLEGARLSVYTQLPFNTGQAKNYFSDRLEDPKSVERATLLYDSLRKQDEEFVGRGFVLNLLADLIARKTDDHNSYIDGNPVEWLMRSLCEREQTRQDLSLSPDEQIQAISAFIVETTQGSEATSELLDAVIGIAAPHLNAESRRNCIKKMTSHPLIYRPAATVNEWSIPQEQVKVSLLAGRLMELSRENNTKELSLFSVRARIDDSLADDIAQMVVDLACSKPAFGQPILQLQKVITSFLNSGDINRDLSVRQHCLRRLAVLVGIRAVDKLLQKGSTHQERTALLLNLFEMESYQNLEFTGAITRMNFTGTTFDTCRFERVRWVNCTFDNTTRFNNCYFIGGSETYCKGLGESRWENFTADEDGQAFINSAQIQSGSKKYTANDLSADIRAVINKFLAKGGIGLKTVRQDYLDSGTIRASQYKGEILRELSRTLLEEHHISGISDPGLRVREAAKECMKFYATNNVFTGPLRSVFDSLKKKLELKE